jgi:hypothetical protein
MKESPPEAEGPILTKHGYPPDTQGKATQTVVEQAELICADAA